MISSINGQMEEEDAKVIFESIAGAGVDYIHVTDL